MSKAPKTKEQKQMIFLCVLGAAAILYSLNQFVIKPLSSGDGGSVSDLGEFRAKVENAEMLLGRRMETQAKYESTREELLAISREMIPPGDNQLSWVTEKIYRTARQIGVDIESVGEVHAVFPNQGSQITQRRFFDPYRVNIVTSSGFFKMLTFLDALVDSNPYLTVNNISISANPNSPEAHAVRIAIDWPIWADSNAPQQIDAGFDGAGA